MARTKPDQLAEWVTEELVTYLGSGTLNQHQLAATIDYSDLTIDSFDELKQLHFVLDRDIVEYIEKLPERLRRVKSVNRRTSELTHGEVRGRIDWQKTIQQRAQHGNDPSVFVVESPEIEYDIPENRVVKALLAAIARPLKRDLSDIGQDWRSKWSNGNIIELQRTLANNVYLDALPDPKEFSVDNRDLETARRARQRLYQDGARLYRLYRDLMNNRFDREPVRDLLEETMVSPMRDHQLFELFCLFGEVHGMDTDLSWRRIHPGMDEVALLEDETRRVEVFYDQNGPLEFFEAYPPSGELEQLNAPEMVVRHARALEDHGEILDGFLDRDTSKNFYAGRPDFLILDYDRDTGGLQEVVIGEVKYTASRSTFSDGLRELLEYVHFAQENADYLFREDGVPVRGVLCTDGVDTEKDSVGIIEHHATEDIQRQFSGGRTDPDSI